MNSSLCSSQQATHTPRNLPKPWKEIGYRGFSAFLASDNDFLIFRRFGALNARILLQLQDELTILERELAELEEKHAKPDAIDIHNGSFRQEVLHDRTRLMSQIHTKVTKYSKYSSSEGWLKLTLIDKLLIQHSTLRAQPKVPKQHIGNIAAWFHNTQNAIEDEEQGYLRQTHDLVQLVHKPTTPLRHLLEKSTRFRIAKLWKKKTPKQASENFPHPETLHYASDSKIDAFVGITITFLGMAMLIVPLWILAITHGTMKRLGVITGFIVLFLALIALTTVARPFESLAAAAAYSAVLVVFLQIAG